MKNKPLLSTIKLLLVILFFFIGGFTMGYFYCKSVIIEIAIETIKDCTPLSILN